MSIYELIAELLDTGSAPDEVAFIICHRDDIADLAYPLVAAAARGAVRAEVRQEEEKVRASNGFKVDPSMFDTGLTAAQKLRGLLEASVWIPSVGLIAWGDVTAEQHRARAAYLLAQASSITKTARSHEAAARLIERSQVRCLRDLTKVAAA